MSEILNNVNDLRLQADIRNERLVVTSGGFDPMHVGHLRCLIESADFVKKVGNKTRLAVIVNGDGFLLRKKGYSFMPLEERMEIIAGVRGVDYVVPWDDGGQTVVGAIEVLKPFAFTKGGDRDAAANVPEFDVCERLGTRVIFGVGGGKIQSSSELVAAIRDANRQD
jgi:D-beta-D-heptose 7-phosphate kinase/D-beta-D-heptose 1-phosphate adenosyltransferase